MLFWDAIFGWVRVVLTSHDELDAHAMNEVNIHRGKDPHLAIVEVFVDGRFLTEGVVCLLLNFLSFRSFPCPISIQLNVFSNTDILYRSMV